MNGGERESKETPQQVFDDLATAVDEFRGAVHEVLLPKLENLRMNLNRFKQKMDEYSR